MNARVQPSEPPTPPVLIERRERRQVQMNGYAILPDGSTCPITLTDLSYDGCGIAVAAKLESGDAIKLSVLGRSAIGAEVRWWSDGKAGLVFEPQPPVEPPQQHRVAERITLRADVIVRRAGRHNFVVNLQDVSPLGCKFEFVDRPLIGEPVWLKFDGLEGLAASICWVEGICAGLKFVKPIHPAVFDLLLERLRMEAAGPPMPPA